MYKNNKYLTILGFCSILLLSSTLFGDIEMVDPNPNSFSSAPYIEQNLVMLEPADFLQNEDTLHYDGANSTGIGATAGGIYIPAVRFTPVQGCSVKAILFYHYGAAAHSGYVYFFNTGTSTTPGVKLESMPYSSPSAGWFRIDFTSRWFAANTDFWLAVWFNQLAGEYPIGADAGPRVVGRNFRSFDGTTWAELTLAYNYNIRALVKYPPPYDVDVGVDAILAPGASHLVNTSMTPMARVKNFGTITQTFPVVCSIIGTGHITRHTNTQTVTSLAGSATANVTFTSWTPTISELCTVIVRTNLVDSNPANNRKVSTTIIGLVYGEDFETNNGGFTADPPVAAWEWGVPTSGPNAAHSGTKLWATVLAGNYINSANWKLTSREYIANSDNPILKFWHWYSFEGTSSRYDGGNVKISNEPTGPWTLINPVGGYDGIAYTTNVAIAGESCYAGPTVGQVWTEEQFNLSVVSGQRFYIRWHFGTDPSVNTYPGWYVDDVSGIGFMPAPVLTNDVGIAAIVNPGVHHFVNTPMAPIAKVKNYGTATQTNFPVICSIVGAGGVFRYTNTQTVTSLAAGDSVLVNFSTWTPTIMELCTVKTRTKLTSDEYSGNDRKTQATNISNTVDIIIGTGTSGSSIYLMYGYYAYSASEAIYLQPEIGINGYITDIAYYKTSGTLTTQFDDVRIYMRHTTATSTATGAWDTTGYTRVYSGTFPFSAVGWMSVRLSNSFAYNNTENLQVLILKGPPAITSGYPSWQYTTTSPVYQNRYQYGAAWPTSLTQTYYRPNVKLSIQYTPGVEEKPIISPVITSLNITKPNPVINGLARISFILAEPTKSNLSIYDASVRLIKTLVNSDLDKGIYTYNWNGTDDYNRKVAEGIYFYTLKTSQQNYTKKMIFTR